MGLFREMKLDPRAGGAQVVRRRPARRACETGGASRTDFVMNRTAPSIPAREARHSIVYRNEREFCGWPFVSGFWTNARGHHLVAFQRKPAAYTDPADVHHDEVAKVGPKIVLARSRDNGQHWSLEPGFLYDLSADPEALFASTARDSTGAHPATSYACATAASCACTAIVCRPSACAPA